MKQVCSPEKTIKGDSGAATVETLLIMAVFISSIVFAGVQFALLSFTSIAACDSVFAAARSAAVSGDLNQAGKNAAFCGNMVFLSIVNPRDSLPAGNKVSEYKANTGVINSRSGNRIFTAVSRQNYLQKIMFSSIISPLLGGKDIFIVSGGKTGSFFSGGYAVYKGAKSCAFVMSPDPEYYQKAYPGSAKW